MKLKRTKKTFIDFNIVNNFTNCSVNFLVFVLLRLIIHTIFQFCYTRLNTYNILPNLCYIIGFTYIY